ncbi:hypothetical protein FVE85_3938 [Porphyridium purpureum]|uniref:Uncharacterized protein n=1 Tax=Porphyridium purpureum TaxID=35688 RepID=A0A5J4YT42_PORPP|nr:hypothetical protein FVE85_3938 [Porphyridium purpureum]|eukprot:POR8054..scf229_5
MTGSRAYSNDPIHVGTRRGTLQEHEQVHEDPITPARQAELREKWARLPETVTLHDLFASLEEPSRADALLANVSDEQLEIVESETAIALDQFLLDKDNLEIDNFKEGTFENELDAYDAEDIQAADAIADRAIDLAGLMEALMRRFAQLQRVREGLEWMEQCVRLDAALYGDTSEEVAARLKDGGIYAMENEVEDKTVAIKWLERAHAVAVNVESLTIGWNLDLNNLMALAYINAGLTSKAVRVFTDILPHTGGGSDEGNMRRRLTILSNLIQALMKDQAPRTAEVLRMTRAELLRAKRIYASKPELVSDAYFFMANTLADEGIYEPAEQLVRECREMLEKDASETARTPQYTLVLIALRDILQQGPVSPERQAEIDELQAQIEADAPRLTNALSRGIVEHQRALQDFSHQKPPQLK